MIYYHRRRRRNPPKRDLGWDAGVSKVMYFETVVKNMLEDPEAVSFIDLQDLMVHVKGVEKAYPKTAYLLKVPKRYEVLLQHAINSYAEEDDYWYLHLEQMFNNLPRYDSTKELCAYAFPGGYPIFYLDKSNDVLCPDDANRAEIDGDYDGYPQDAGINYEDPHLFCDECGERIESAYAEDEDEDE
jgi:hypothetical protein